MPAFDIAELTFQEELSNSVFLIANYFSHSIFLCVVFIKIILTPTPDLELNESFYCYNEIRFCPVIIRLKLSPLTQISLSRS